LKGISDETFHSSNHASFSYFFVCCRALSVSARQDSGLPTSSNIPVSCQPGGGTSPRDW